MNQKSVQKVSIFDCEYYYNCQSIPNWKVTKISSYYKQKGWTVNLYDPEYGLTYDYDKLYIIRENASTKLPPTRLYDDYDAILMGDAFQSFPNYQSFPLEMAGVRPDYLIYPKQKRNLIDKANFVQFYCGFYEIETMQDWHNGFAGNKITIVVDDNFWDFKDENLIIKKLKVLQEEYRVGFLYPIKLKKILSSPALTEEFYKLKFSVRFRNKLDISHIPHTYENAVKIIDFITHWDKKYRSFKPLRFNTITTDHWENEENSLNDMKRCIKIMHYAKLNGIRITFRTPSTKIYSKDWRYFNVIKYWSNNAHKKSFVEFMLYWTAQKVQKDLYELTSDKKYWKSDWNVYLRKLIHEDEEFIKKYGLIEWEDKSLPEESINFKYMKENTDENIILWLRDNGHKHEL